jgi:cytochrome c2
MKQGAPLRVAWKLISRVSVGLLVVPMAFARTEWCVGSEPPFVAGFDRFVRHREIDGQIGGRLLLAELNCTACHPSAATELAPKLGPRLDGAGSRLQQAWIGRFLESPQAVKPGTTMPDALAGLDTPERTAKIAALVAFLSAQQPPFPEIKATGTMPVPHEFWNKGDVEQGRQLYHLVGCVACHEPDRDYDSGAKVSSGLDQLLAQLTPEEVQELGLTAAARPVRSVPHGDLSAKYTPKSLAFFLFDPAAVRPGGRMPSLKLTPVEAADIAAFLLRDQAPEAGDGEETLDASLIEKGRRAFHELKCINCHSVQGAEPSTPAKLLGELNVDAARTCFGQEQRGLPHFELDDAQIQFVRLALAELRAGTVAKPTPHEQLGFRLLQLNCYACHERDHRGGVGRDRQRFFETARQIDLGDEGRLPPPLTGVGHKLQRPWFKKVFEGTGDVRPHLLARMPKFPSAEVAALPELFAAVDAGRQPTEQQVFGNDAGLADAGRALLDSGCVQCHPLRGESLPGVMGVDLLGAAGRVHPRWFRDLVFDPAQLKPGTRMPTFFPNGKSANPQVLDGDVDRQIAAMWTYVKQLDRQPLPEKIVQARSQDFELAPKDTPIILRTFMQRIGPQAIAVGFPQRVHFAFDAEAIRLAQAWRGRFLDAHGTWFDRSQPPAAPLGEEPIDFPSGPPLAWLRDPQQSWPDAVGGDAGYRFMGYRLDAAGIPTFLYRVGAFEVADRIEPDDSRGLLRRLHIAARDPSGKQAAKLWLRAILGKDLRRQQPRSYTNPDGLTVIVADEVDRAGKLRSVDKNSEWIIPIVVHGEAAIEVQYRW